MPISRRKALGSFSFRGGLFHRRLSGANRRVTSSTEKASGSKSSQAVPGQKRMILLSERPFLPAFRGIRFTCGRSRPFSEGERASYYAAAGVLSRSSGILFNVKPNGDWLAVRYNDTENNMALWEFHNGICKPGQIQ